MDKNSKIVFMGTPDYATVIFNKLLEHGYDNIAALYTQPDKPIGRKQVLTAPDIKKYAIENGYSFPIHQPQSLKAKDIDLQIKDLKPDVIIVAAYGQILPKSILDIAPCINLHASLLPKYRGASPIQQAILNNDSYTGVTAMLMDEGLDSGKILGYKYCKITKEMVVSELFDQLSQIAAQLTIETLENFEKLEPKKQNESEVSFCGKVKKSHGKIDFENAQNLYTKYKAYKSWPDIYLESSLKIKECKIEDESSQNKAGDILDIRKDSIVVGCTKGSIEIFFVQPPSKKQMSVVDYIRGARIERGDTFS